MSKQYRKPQNRLTVRPGRASAKSERTDSYTANPPRCLWRDMWYHKVGEDTLVMNASIFRTEQGLVGEFYTFWNAERITQLDMRITDMVDRETLENLLMQQAARILKRCGIVERGTV